MPERYGRKDLAPEVKEKVRKQILVCVSVAEILRLLTDMKILWIFETAAFFEKQTSVLRFDEYQLIMAMPGVKLKVEVQCLFVALARPYSLHSYLQGLPPSQGDTGRMGPWGVPPSQGDCTEQTHVVRGG